MNTTLIRAFLLQRFTSPMRLGLTSLFTFFPLVGVALSGELSLLAGIAGPLAVLYAAGAIGQDVSSGTLQLLLVRPVTRPAYVLHRWLGAMLAALAVVLTTVLCAVLLLFLRGTPPEAVALARLLLEAVTAIAGHSAVMVMLSSLVGGVGDVALYAASLFVAQMFVVLATWKQWTWLLRACNEVQGVLGAKMSWAWLGTGMAPSAFDIVSWASTITLALAVAIAVMNRKELSYASG
jgi:ABC-type transport system involved in multi-copper enzyme maturation permease subunit